MVVKITMNVIGSDLSDPLSIYYSSVPSPYSWQLYGTESQYNLSQGVLVTIPGDQTYYYMVIDDNSGSTCYQTSKIFDDCYAGLIPTTTTTTAAVPPTTTTTTTPAVTCVQISESLGYNISSPSLACSASGSVYYGDSSTFTSTTPTIISTNTSCSAATVGWYSNGFYYKYWDGTSITTASDCQSLPQVITYSGGSVSYDTAQLGGEVTFEGDETVTEMGVCWSTSSNPLTGDTTQIMSTGSTTFPFSFSDTAGIFITGTTYYFRAYAISAVGTGYGSVDSFTTTTGPTYNYYNAVSYVCSGCTLESTGDFIKSLDELDVGMYYNGLDGYVYLITDHFGGPTATTTSSSLGGVDCAAASAAGGCS